MRRAQTWSCCELFTGSAGLRVSQRHTVNADVTPLHAHGVTDPASGVQNQSATLDALVCGLGTVRAQLLLDRPMGGQMLRQRSLLRVFAVSACGLVSYAQAANPSFDCTKAKQPAELTICGSERLASLDNAVSRGYAYLKALSGQQYAESIVGPYLLDRYKCRFDEVCIGALYLDEIKAFARLDVPLDVLGGPSLATVASPPAVGVGGTPATQLPSVSASALTVPLVGQNGTFAVPVSINGQITLNFVVDSGASDVSVPADVVMTLIRTGTITDSDFIGSQTYVLADGSKVPSERFVIRSLKVGGASLENVTASVASVAGSLLLGQSFLSRFNSWSIDNARHALILGGVGGSANDSATLVQGFYKALSAGSGELASAFIAPERRTGPFSPSEIGRFYGTLPEPLKLLSAEEVSDGTYLVHYTFRSDSRSCDGRAIVSTVNRQDGRFISGIRALNGC